MNSRVLLIAFLSRKGKTNASPWALKSVRWSCRESENCRGESAQKGLSGLLQGNSSTVATPKSPRWRPWCFSFPPWSFYCKTCIVSSPVRSLPNRQEHLQAFLLRKLPFFFFFFNLLFGPTRPVLTEWDATATIELYNIVHKSSLCECTFDKVYLFICKHLIMNRQYI